MKNVIVYNHVVFHHLSLRILLKITIITNYYIHILIIKWRQKQEEQEQYRDKENTPFSADSTEKNFLQPLRQLREFKQLWILMKL